MTYNANIVLAFWADCGLPPALPEFKFHPKRQWRFDFAFPNYRREVLGESGDVAAVIETLNAKGGLAIEVQGGIWTRGRHTRGSGLVKEHEKLNVAAAMGWRILYCTPQEVMTLKFARTIQQALNTEDRG